LTQRYDERQFRANSKTGMGRGQSLTYYSAEILSEGDEAALSGLLKKIIGEARKKSTSGVLIVRCSESIERSNHMGLFSSLREIGRAESILYRGNIRLGL
jgi:hypothetical protein